MRPTPGVSASMRHALVIGGTGPTGHFIVNGLIERGFTVSILHTGRHEVDEIPATVTHFHTNPFDDRAVRDVLNRAQFDLTIAMYGRLRRLAEIMSGRETIKGSGRR
jgi:nucleoside-diphosphate-sugar epimerase